MNNARQEGNSAIIKSDSPISLYFLINAPRSVLCQYDTLDECSLGDLKNG